MPIRITCLIKRRSDMTQEQFSKHWKENHAKIFTSLKAVQQNIVKYNQFHVLEQPSETFGKLTGLQILPYDGAVEFYVDKLEDLFALFGDEEYQQKAIPDEPNFLDRSQVAVLVGEDHTMYIK